MRWKSIPTYYILYGEILCTACGMGVYEVAYHHEDERGSFRFPRHRQTSSLAEPLSRWSNQWMYYIYTICSLLSYPLQVEVFFGDEEIAWYLLGYNDEAIIIRLLPIGRYSLDQVTKSSGFLHTVNSVQIRPDWADVHNMPINVLSIVLYFWFLRAKGTTR